MERPSSQPAARPASAPVPAWLRRDPRVLRTASPQPLPKGPQTVGEHRLEWLPLAGRPHEDLVLIDHTSGVAFVGDLVYADRVPTARDVSFDHWLKCLDRLESLYNAGCFRWMVPSQGQAIEGLQGIAQTRDWILWLTQHMRRHAQLGTPLQTLLGLPVPPRFAHWAALSTELHRTLLQCYPLYEAQALPTL
jgi:glyoxylase-like metal-dependent hydrolase (beta-lactamase superfamily II)